MPLSPKCVIVTKPGFRQTGFSLGLLTILEAIDHVVRVRRVPGCPRQVTLTAGSNGHNKGGHVMPRVEAADIRSKDFKDGVLPRTNAVRRAPFVKRHFLVEVMAELQPVVRIYDDGRKIVTADYFGQLEHEGKRNEHFHFQVRKGHTIR